MRILTINNGRVSHETIYQALYVQSRGRLRADLHEQLSTHRPKRRQRGRASRGGASPFTEAFTISERPAEVEDRAVPGHWEGDLIVGPFSRSAIGTLVERSTRFTILLHLPGRHTAEEVAEAMIREMNILPEHLRRSLTWDLDARHMLTGACQVAGRNLTKSEWNSYVGQDVPYRKTCEPFLTR